MSKAGWFLGALLGLGAALMLRRVSAVFDVSMSGTWRPPVVFQGGTRGMLADLTLKNNTGTPTSVKLLPVIFRDKISWDSGNFISSFGFNGAPGGPITGGQNESALFTVQPGEVLALQAEMYMSTFVPGNNYIGAVYMMPADYVWTGKEDAASWPFDSIYSPELLVT